MSEEQDQIEAILDHLLAGGDAPPHADSEDPLVRKLHNLARERIEVREGTRAFSYLSTISHELRTPLNAIIGYSELLLEEGHNYDTPTLQADMKRIQEAGRHLLGLINEVLEVAHIESGRAKVHRRNVLIEPLIRELLPTMMPAVRRQGNQFRWQVDRELCAYTDGTKLRTVLRTLVNRAARVTTNGEISLSAELGDKLVIEVLDSGTKVTTEELARSFHPFTGGNGSGLTSTARLVELIGGQLEVESVAQGTRFRVVLPSSLGNTEDERQPLPTVPEGVRVVLVVNSDKVMRSLMERTLSRLDCVVVSASSGQEALRIAEAIRPNVIAIEADQDDAEGWNTLGRIKSRPELAGIPVVMLSGKDNQDAVGADDYITKPFDRPTMLQTISSLLDEGARKRVLVVDDESDARELARRVLTSAGYLVDEVPNGRAAMDYLSRQRPDLILLDLMMPEMDGFQVIQELKKIEDVANVPIVVLTAMTLTDSDRKRLAARAQTIVTKGTGPSVLLDRVAAVLQR